MWGPRQSQSLSLRTNRSIDFLATKTFSVYSISFLRILIRKEKSTDCVLQGTGPRVGSSCFTRYVVAV